jgi:hypothetical protein
MGTHIDVHRDLLFPAPPHIAIWALNASYAGTEDDALVMTRSDCDTQGIGCARYKEWTYTVRRLLSRDNGVSWVQIGDMVSNGSLLSGPFVHGPWQHLSCSKGQLLAVHNVSTLSGREEAREGHDAWSQRSTTFWYEVSMDGGANWSSPRQVVHARSDCNETQWMPGITAGEQNGMADQAPFIELGDRSVLFGFTVNSREHSMGVAFLRGRWTGSGDRLEWDVSEQIRVPDSVSVAGVCEPDLAYLGGGRVLTTMRCQGNKERGIFSTRQFSVSEDGGQKWSVPRALQYDDGAIVCVPASISRFMQHPQTGAVYWFANILDTPVYGQIPRYPLCVAQLDTDRLCLLKDTVTVVQDLPEGAPAADEEKGELGRRYSNFGHYVDRKTGEFVLMMGEEPKISWDDGTADCVRLRVRIRP